MQALILATDEASRLHPLTEHVPAPLLPVLNRPIMAYPLELLVRSGLRDIGIAVYNKAGAIEAHFATGTGSGAQLTYLLQREALGSAGSLRWAAAGLKTLTQATFVVLPGDALVDFDISAALAFHRSHGGIVTVIVHAPLASGAPEPGYPFGPVAVAAGGRVTEFSPQAAEPVPVTRTFANTGAFIFEPQIIDWIASLQRQRQQQALDCHADLLQELLGREAVHAYVAEGYWNPIHSVPAYHQAQLDALAGATSAPLAGGAPDSAGSAALPRVGEAPAVRYVAVQDRELAPGILAGQHVSVHPSARLVAPVYIGAGSQIERDVELGPDVVIGANTIVDEGATIRNSSVLEGTYVGQSVMVDKRVVAAAW
jgi:NDP-sugar pyrophosphorylase family protein